ncbi:uncharacterized protein LOC131021255 [Salvia miltiorrhiza]|uniref:uncharacterized protein LOC131021255 n=1 Tax=Salvia miltiorrhiza TaxID=226208 RepID=UPI0025AD225A|nr:uncharacterized protein LOC131021255 [Salvia miltiorrhiza]
MVAISLYKGNLHKLTDAPHRWPRPTPKISLKEFKILLRRRARALSRLRTSDSDLATTSNPNPSPAPVSDPNSNPSCGNFDPSSARNAIGGGNHVDILCSTSGLVVKGDLKKKEGEKEEVGKEADEISIEGEGSLRKLVDKDNALAVEGEKEDAENVKNDGRAEVPVNKAVEIINMENATSDTDKRSKEVKEKLEVLNEKKHSLVQVLKQILSAEEHLKRPNCVQGMPSRPPLPLQVDNTTDSGSMVRVNTPRTGKDGNPCGDMEGVEADDVSNHNTHSRHLVRTSSTSPSSDSQQRKQVSNSVPHSYRTTLVVAGSPSRFAPAAQGPPSVSVSGASYITSSPSPAASGGTSVFRDGRLPSPWN